MESVLRYLIDYFPDLLEVNLTASIVILFVICARLFLRRAPKIFSYVLWAIVLLRLLVPISIESSVSVVPKQTEFVSMVELNEALPRIEFESPGDRATNQWIWENTPPGEPFAQTSRSLDAQTYLTFSWMAGMVFMLLRSVVSYWKLQKRVRVAIPLRKGIYIADDIDTPFVMGIFRPVIYLPGTLDKAERKYIIAHELHHICRGDHIFKALGYLALTIHWFNPLVWVAFVLVGRDMEMSCDEAVIRKFGEDIRADYSASLLNLATGHRLFAGNPLAFGEGNPTDRVRNLAKWKKPAFWMVLICVVLCLVLAVCLLTNPETDAPDEINIVETIPTVATEAEVTPVNDWGVSIKPDRVSRTGATALFVYSGSIPGEEGVELYYGDLLTLERVDENGNWVVVEELPGYEYYVGDSSYPVVDGYGMVHEWQDRFGELPDGHYRMGKSVALVRPDGSAKSQMVYGEFVLPDSVRTGMIPLNELPEVYSAEQAMIDGCFITEDGTARENKELFKDFAVCSWNGMPGVIRIVNWHYGEDSHWSAMDLNFDGNVYTITTLENTYTFKYLKQFTGEKAWEGADHDAFDYYVLVNDNSVTFEDIMSGKLDMSDWKNPAHWTVYANFIYRPKQPQLPMNPSQAVLEFEGQSLVTTTDFDRLEKIWILFQEAEYLGYEPKTHSVGVGLNLILTSQSGETMTIELDPDSDICRINGEYVFYGAYDEPNYIEKLWYYLGINAWPDVVYEKYPNAYQPFVS